LQVVRRHQARKEYIGKEECEAKRKWWKIVCERSRGNLARKDKGSTENERYLAWSTKQMAYSGYGCSMVHGRRQGRSSEGDSVHSLRELKTKCTWVQGMRNSAWRMHAKTIRLGATCSEEGAPVSNLG
jgi:hypothetical protein